MESKLIIVAGLNSINKPYTDRNNGGLLACPCLTAEFCEDSGSKAFAIRCFQSRSVEPPSPRMLISHADISDRRVRNIVFAYFVLRHFRRAVRRLRGRGIIGTVIDAYSYAQRYAYGVFLNFPGIKTKVQGQVDEALKKLEDKLVQKGPGVTRYLELPREGFTEEQAKAELKKQVIPLGGEYG